MKKAAIIGGGISGLAALHFIRSRYGDKCSAVLFEADNRLGGTIGTDRSDGFTCEWGPNGFLDKIPLTLEMVAELGASSLLEPSDNKSGKRFIYRSNRLHEIIPSPLGFMKSSLLSLKGRLRLVREPFVAGRREWVSDESIYDFAVRRIGREAAETLIVPMVSGIFGGDAKELSLRACFPVMVEMEKEYGSLIKAMIKRRKKSRDAGAGKSAGPAGPGGRLTSFTGGLMTLIDVFENKYREFIRTGYIAEQIKPMGSQFEITFRNGAKETFDAVICAAPAYAAAEMVKGAKIAMANVLQAIPYAPIAVVCLGYRRADVAHDLDGFGFLIPRNQNIRILGSIWTSSIFVDRAPEGMILMRTMIGGATDHEAASLANDKLLEIATNELKSIVGLNGEPAHVRIFKYDRGIPQFVIGHPEKVAALDEMTAQWPGLYFTGNAYEGVGLNDCVLRSDKIVSRLAADLF